MTRLDWIKARINDANMDYKLVQDIFYEDYCEKFGTIELKSFNDTVKRAYNTMVKQNKNDVDEDFDIEQNIKLEKNLQKKADLTTYYRRNSRNNYRALNEVESICEELINRLDTVKFDIPKINTVKEKKEKKTALLCLSDLHAGTLINAESEDLCYDYNILSRRLKKYITKAIETMKKNDVTNVWVVGLGDWVSSSRRIDEILGQVSSTTNSLLIVVTIVEQILVELANNFEHIYYTSIVGNESRVSAQGQYSEIGWHSMELMNNWDFLQYTMLKHILNGKIKNLNFVDSDSPLKSLIRIPIDNNETYNVCIAHGHAIKQLRDKAEEVYTNSYTEDGEKVDICVIGHYHRPSVYSSGKLIVTGTPMRNNVYCNSTIGTKGHSFQNLILINNDGSYWSCPIKLDDISDFKEGYKIQKELDLFTYNESKVDKVNIAITYN